MAGYWLSGYWMQGYWMAGYWLGGGGPAPTPTRPRGSGAVHRRHLLMTLGPHRRREPWTWQERPERQKVGRA